MRRMVKTAEEPVVAGTQSRMKNHIMAIHTHNSFKKGWVTWLGGEKNPRRKREREGDRQTEIFRTLLRL